MPLERSGFIIKVWAIVKDLKMEFLKGVGCWGVVGCLEVSWLELEPERVFGLSERGLSRLELSIEGTVCCLNIELPNLGSLSCCLDSSFWEIGNKDSFRASVEEEISDGLLSERARDLLGVSRVLFKDSTSEISERFLVSKYRLSCAEGSVGNVSGSTKDLFSSSGVFSD